MKKSALLSTAVLTTAAFLSGCLVPERFTAKLDVHPDAGYTFKYSGTAVHALAAAQIKKAGSLTEKDENGLKAEAEKMSKNADVKKAAYKGKGRYELELEASREAGQSLRMFGIFSVSTDKEGIITISSQKMSEKNKRELEQIGLTVNGTFAVNLPKNIEVISQNATSTPTLGFGSYSWNIGRIDQQSMMKFKIKQ
jgi:hypothetical protein